MTTLRQNFIRELVIRGTSPRTQSCYVSCIAQLAKYYHRSPDRLSDDQLKDYVFYLAYERKLAASSLNQRVSAMRTFYLWVLRRSVVQLWLVLPRVNRAIRRPQVFSIEELEQLFNAGCSYPKHRTFLMTVYGAGLRLSEACRLKVEHIHPRRMQIRVEQGKGRKDRYTLLSPALLQELRSYWQYFRPQHWLFPATNEPQQPM